MNGLHLHTGNRLETLACRLAAVVEESPMSPLTPEIVVVQSLGMRRWLSLQLAERLGVCLNFQFPFPHGFLDALLRKIVPEMAPAGAFQTDATAWRIHGLLPRLLADPEFAPVRLYLSDDDAPKRYQLAARLAGLFDQYLVYRPEMVVQWEDRPAAPGPQAWQSALWRELNRSREIHFAAALERLSDGFAPDADLPGRISVFGISSLPPAQMRVLFALAAVRPVHLFLLRPSCEYHADDLTPKQQARRGLRLEPMGNPLLTSLGRLSAEFTRVLLEADERAGHRIIDASEQFEDPGTDSLLHTIQGDVLHARTRDGGGDESLERLEVRPDDGSLEVHVCHSPLREVETLYDRLLDLFANDRALQPHDVLVMTPDIESYAPLIHAVFGYPENAAHRIPYSIADRTPQSASPVIATFLALLDLPGTRYTAPQVFELLQSPPFRQRFGFDDGELALIRRWIQETGVRWGIDAWHREELGGPAFNESTWRHGLDRLLLGYAMSGDNRAAFEGILPQDDVEGTSAELAGRLASAVETLVDATRGLTQPRPLGEWPDALRMLADLFFIPSGDNTADLRVLRTAIDRFDEVARQAGPEQMVEFAPVREHIAGALNADTQRGGFLTGGVTFCALKPMRSIPARAIWLLGMNDDAFPRKSQPPQFDLIAASPTAGDRSVRNDDRYLFLEALLAARDRCFISHVGRSPVSREEFPPSVVVSELLDQLDQCCKFPEGKSARGWLTFEHRLHAFNRAYFEPNGRLFSYSAANCAAATVTAANRRQPLFLNIPLAEPEGLNVELASLVRFFDNPAAAFLRERLGVWLDSDAPALGDCEPMGLEPLPRYQVCNELLQAQAANDASPAEVAFTARALLPTGSVGAQHYGALRRKTEALCKNVRALLGTTGRDAPRPIDLRVGQFTVTGRLEALYGGRLAFFRPAEIKPKDRTRAWVQHLVWCIESPTAPPPTLLAGNDEALQFAPLSREAAGARLLELAEIYRRGMTRPLPFFPMSAFEFATPRKSGIPPIQRAREKWRGGFVEGEQENPAYRLCFGDRDPLDAEFESLAVTVFGAMNAEAMEWA